VLAVWGGAAGSIYMLGMVHAVQRFAGPARTLGMALLNTAYLLGGALGAPLGGWRWRRFRDGGCWWGWRGVARSQRNDRPARRFPRIGLKRLDHNGMRAKLY